MSTRLCLSDRLSVDVASSLQASWLQALDAAAGDFEIDAAAVERVDGAGLQLLIAAQREAERLGRQFRLLAPSAELLRTLQLTGLAARFALPAGSIDAGASS